METLLSQTSIFGCSSLSGGGVVGVCVSGFLSSEFVEFGSVCDFSVCDFSIVFEVLDSFWEE